MTAQSFRRMALGLGDTVEGAHMGHPDFRVGNRVFASMNAEQTIGTVKLTPDEQQRFMERDATVFEPAAGAWGVQGWTKVHLAAADAEAVGEALTLSWQTMQAKGPARAKARTTRASSATTAKTPRSSSRATTARKPRAATATASTSAATPAARSAAKPAGKSGATSSTVARASAKASEGKVAAGAARTVIDEYIAACAPSVQSMLNKVRALIRKEAPQAVEKFSYRMPAFEMDGMLLYYAPFKHHLGIYPPVKGDAALAKDLAPFRGEKGNLRFPFDAPMPYPLIRRVIQARLKEHAAHLSEKRATTGRSRASAARSKTRA